MIGGLPEFDPDSPVESAVIRGLARSWPRRATVRRAEPALDGPTMDELFDPVRADYPERLLPFRGHRTFESLDEVTRARIAAWGWIAYNRTVMDVEQYVVNPGFGVLLRDEFGTGFSDTARAAVVQAMCDEEYHTLMHLNASALTRRRRGWSLPESALPPALLVRRHRDAVAAAAAVDGRSAALTALAYAAVAETSIADYLSVLSDDESIQPVSRATVVLHRRDECAHASVAQEMTTMVYERLPDADRSLLVAALRSGVDAFTAADVGVWLAILRAEGVPGAEAMLREVAEDPERRRLGLNCGAVDRLLERLAAC